MTDEQLFHHSITLDREDQSSYLDNACTDDDQKRRVQALLAAHSAADSLLDTASASGSLHETTKNESSLPQSIGDFQILRELGRGGMGVVYEARQKSLKRRVALKVLSSGLGLSSKAILRFRREAEAAGKLHHTNIVPIYTTGEDKGIHYYAMELVDGPSLDQVIKDLKREQCASSSDGDGLQITALQAAARGNDGRQVVPCGVQANGMDASQLENNKSDQADRASAKASSSISTATGSSYFDQVATMMADVADALDHAHEHGVIHRDVKPSNLLLGPDGRLSINDFGLARMLEQPGMTVSGEFVGSPLYMSPEQITAGRVALDHRTDIYSLGATLYELLTLQPPFPGQSRDQVLSQILHKEAPSTRKLNRRVPIDIDTICMKAIDKDPDKRYQTAGKLAEDLRMYLNRYAISARRIGPIGQLVKLVNRNRAISVAISTVLLALTVTIATVRSVRVSYAESIRSQEIENVTDKLYEAYFRNDLLDIDEQLERLDELKAPQERQELFRGLRELRRRDCEGAKDHFKSLLAIDAKNISALALRALAIFWSGDEGGYVEALAEIDPNAAVRFEDQLFLGYASQWANAGLAYKLLSQANDQKKGRQFILLQLGEAGRCLATNIVRDLDKAEGLLNDAENNIKLGIGALAPSPDGDFSFLSVLLDQIKLYEQRSKSTEGQLANDYADKARSKTQELQQAVDELIQRLDTQYKTASTSSTKVFVQAHAIFTALEFLDPSKLEETAERWRTIGVPLNEFTTQRMTLYFLVKGEYEQAQIWFDLARSKNLEQSRFLQTSILLANPHRQLTAAELKNDAKKLFEERLNLGKTGFISFDALLAYLLGDEQALAHLADDHIVKNIHGGGLCSALEEYLANEDRAQIDQDELIERCKSPNESNYALMNANFTLGVEALVNGDDARAKEYFESCIACRQYIFHVYCMSKFMLSHESQWDSWRSLREDTER